jgi:hypothetical protein
MNAENFSKKGQQTKPSICINSTFFFETTNKKLLYKLNRNKIRRARAVFFKAILEKGISTNF